MFYQKKSPRKGPYFKSLARSSYGENRSTDGEFSDEEMVDFLNGAWVKCRSTNVDECTYIEDDETLFVKFLSGDIYQYFNVDSALAETYGRTTSKGGGIWDYFIRQGRPYHRVG